jgi:hypothetical protein
MGLAQVPDEMKSFGALAGLRRALVGASSIEAASVSGHDLDLRMIPEPAGRGSSRSALKDIDDFTPFEVDNNCSVVVSPPGGPIVDAYHANRMACSIRCRPPLQMAQDRVSATGDATLRSSLSPGKPPAPWPVVSINVWTWSVTRANGLATPSSRSAKVTLPQRRSDIGTIGFAHGGSPVWPASANPESDDGRCCGRSSTVSRTPDTGMDQPARSRASTRPHYASHPEGEHPRRAPSRSWSS